MTIVGLDERVDIIFEPDGQYFRLKVPFSKDFLTCYSWPYIWKQKLVDNGWRFKISDYDDIVALLHDFFPLTLSKENNIIK